MIKNTLFHIGVTSMLLASLTGCAAILSGSTTQVRLDSDPPGAKVYDNGSLVGTTPTEVNVIKKKDHTFEFRKTGYISMTRVDGASAGAGWIICDVLLTGLIGVVVDAATESWNGLDYNFIKVALEASTGN
jgi:hypothetical protein